MNKRICPETISRVMKISAAFLLGVSGQVGAMTCSPKIELSQIEAAEAYLNQNRPKDAFRVMYPLTQSGSGGAHQFLANMYEQGRGVKRSPFMVRHLNWMGYQYGDPQSTFRAAQDFYARGYRQDGERLAIAAKDCGHHGAVVLLIERMKMEGRKEEARQYLELGVDLGIPAAKYEVGEAFHNGSFGLPKDPQKAFAWYYLAAKDGYAQAMSAVAYFFVRGLHGVQDDYAAIHWYERASRAGHIESTTAYGWMLANGRGTQVDIDESRRILKIAATQGDITASKVLLELSNSSKQFN